MTENSQGCELRKKKQIVRRFFVAIVFVVAFYLVAKLVLHRATSQAMNQLVMEASKQGAEILLPSFQSVRQSSFLGATWSGLYATEGGRGTEKRVRDYLIDGKIVLTPFLRLRVRRTRSWVERKH